MAARRGQQCRHERGRIIGALAVTILLFVGEIVGGVVSGSLALISDAGHMLSDIAAQGLSLIALTIAARPSDRRRTYGYYRIEILAALANGLLLFLLSAGILWTAGQRLLAGGAGEIRTTLMIVVAACGLVANLIGMWLLHGGESLNIRSAYLHVLQDMLSSVAVLVGGAVMAFAAGFYFIDPLLSIVIALMLLRVAYGLVGEACDVLLEAAPVHVDFDELAAAVRAQPRVVDVHDLHTWTLTTGVFALSAHIVVDTDDHRHNDDLLHRVEAMLLEDFRIAHSTIQIESPDRAHIGITCGHEPDGAAPATTNGGS